MTAPRHVDVGAYVLGILDPPDEAAYERHFAQCEECRREFIELADMPAILDTLKPDRASAKPPALPPLSALIDFEKLRPPKPAAAPPSMPSMPAVPPQQRPNGATQPHRLPRPAPSTPPDRSNGTTRPSPTTPHGQPDRPHDTGRPSPATPHGQADRPRTNGTERPSPTAPHGQPDRPRTNGPARPTTGGPSSTNRSRAEGTGRHGPAGTGRHAPASPGTGRSLPVASRGDSATRSTPGTRPTASPAARSSASGSKAAPARAKPPSKPRDSGPAGRAGGIRGRKPVWLTAAAVVAVALTVGVMIGWPSGEPGNQVADRNTSAPAAPPSDAVAGAHVVSGTDPGTGVTAIITIEPVPNGTEIDMVLYEIDGPQKGVLIAVSRFGEREEVTEWQVPEDGAARGEAIRATGVAPFAQQDINRFELHGDGIEPLLVVPT